MCRFPDFDVKDTLGTQIATFRYYKRWMLKALEKGIASGCPMHQEESVVKILKLKHHFLFYTKIFSFIEKSHF